MTILVDSSVWIDYLRGEASPHTDMLDALLLDRAIVMGDLILAEVLHGIRSDREFELVRERLSLLPAVSIVDEATAIQSARNFRQLRKLGFTIRKTADALIATRCIAEGWTLLHRDRDFAPFEAHLGLLSLIPAE